MTDMRRAFEAWATNDGKYPRATERNPVNGEYLLAFASSGWNVWQAATEASSARIARLEEELRETAQSLAWLSFGECRGFSSNLLTSNQALDLARSALEDKTQ
jgi:hypothetical protein